MTSRTTRRVLATVAATTLPVLFAAGPAVAMPRPGAQAQLACTYGATPVVAWSQSQITELQQPGRHTVWVPQEDSGARDSFYAVVDDAPDLAPTQMRVELDLNPRNGVTWRKSAEFWGYCKNGKVGEVVADLRGGVNVSTDCQVLTKSNDNRSGCTLTRSMVINKATTTEIWFRKPAFLGIWVDAKVLDSSMWDALGGRSVRFIWYQN